MPPAICLSSADCGQHWLVRCRSVKWYIPQSFTKFNVLRMSSMEIPSEWSISTKAHASFLCLFDHENALLDQPIVKPSMNGAFLALDKVGAVSSRILLVTVMGHDIRGFLLQMTNTWEEHPLVDLLRLILVAPSPATHRLRMWYYDHRFEVKPL